MWTVFITDWHPTSVNVLLGAAYAGRGARFAAAARKREDAKLLAIYCRVFEVPRATGPRRVSLTLGLGPRMRSPDPDNLWKSLLDGLVKCGVLVNDSPRWCEPRWCGTTRGLKATTVVIEDLPKKMMQ